MEQANAGPLARGASGNPGSGQEARLAWVEFTRSPQARATGATLEPCSSVELGLEQVAAWVASERARVGRAPDVADVSFRLRAAGIPHVWPRVWALEGDALGDELVKQRLGHWLAKFEPGGERRCGLARARSAAGKSIVAVVVVDALADLEPLPVRTRVGRWLTLEAHMLAPASDARVILLGPSPLPRSVPASMVDGRVRAAFSLDQAGAWRVQVVTTTAEGPRPALEAWVFADSEPYTESPADAVPGEAAASSAVNDSRMLLQLINAARSLEQLAALSRDAALDRLAQAHAEAMRDTETPGHDVGDGSPAERVEAAGLGPRRVGENVAHAQSLLRAHRALWESPAHRETLLSSRYDVLGLGIAGGPDGSVWVCELFADYGEAGNPPE